MAALALASAPAGCSDETTPGGGAGGGGDAPRFDESSCSYCVDAYCAGDVAGCLGEPECASFLGCLRACPVGADGGPDPACEAACPVPTSTAGQSAYQAFAGCRSSDIVKAACGGCPGALPDSQVACLAQSDCDPNALPDEDNLCVQCLARRCCDTKAAFDANAEANALLDCWLACTANDCYAACDAMHPDGLADLGNYLLCTSHLCLAQCTDTTPSACDVCLYRTCADELATSQCDHADALLLQDCVVACNNDATCEMGCYAQYPEQAEREEAYVTCVTQKCAVAGC